MSTHMIQVSNNVYRKLQAQAARLQLTPEQLVEHLLTSAEVGFITDAEEQEQEQNASIPPAGSPAALSAVEHLTTLFGDVAIPDLERVLADPSLALSNVGLGDLIDLKP